MYRVNTMNTQDMSNLFDEFFNATTKATSYLKVDIRDLGKEYIVELDVPGYTKEQLDINFKNEKLVVTAIVEEIETTEEDAVENNGRYVHRERTLNNAKRTIFLKDVDPTKFKAKLENGVLTIRASKKEELINSYNIDIE